MLIQQFQRPTRLLAAVTTVCLLYLCLNYLDRSSFSSCGVLPFGGTSDGSGLEGAPSVGFLRPPLTSVSTRPKSRVAKVGVAVNALDIPAVYRAFESHKVQNDLHGYLHYIADTEVVDSLTDHDHFRRGSGAYTKPAYLLAIMIAELLKPEAERLQWLFWFDGDTVILNPSTPLETFLPPNSSSLLNDVHVVIAANWDGLNSGAFALRVHRWTASFLSAVLAYPIYEQERTTHDRFRDQSAFQFLLKHVESPLAREKFGSRNHWAEVPMRWFNSLPVNNAFYNDGTWLFGKNMTQDMFDNGTTAVFNDGRGGKVQAWKVMRGDMMVHFAGTKNVRDSWMTPWLDRAQERLPEWDNATFSANLADEVSAWWRDWNRQATVSYVEAKIEESKKEEPKKEEPKKEEPKKEEPKKEESKKDDAKKEDTKATEGTDAKAGTKEKPLDKANEVLIKATETPKAVAAVATRAAANTGASRNTTG